MPYAKASKVTAASVALFREPRRRPARLPDCPGWNSRLRPRAGGGTIVSRAMNAVTTALACGEITRGEAATIAGIYETFVRTAGAASGEGRPRQPAADLDDVEDEDEDIADAEAIDDCDP
jgi:hypothetical protein